MGLGAVDLWIGERNKTLNSGWVLGLRWGGSCLVMGVNQKARDRETQLEERILIDFKLETESSKRQGDATRGESSVCLLIRK